MNRDVGWQSWAQGAWQDLRFSLRQIRRAPGFTAVAVLTLGLAIGANTAIFSAINGLLLRPMPVRDPHRLVTVSSDTAIGLGFRAGIGWNHPMWDRLRQRQSAFDGALAVAMQAVNLVEGGETTPANGLFVSGEFFRTLGPSVERGRMLEAGDDVRGGGPNGPATVISYGLWQRRFRGDPNIVGTTLNIDNVPFTIVGVTAREFHGLEVGRPFDVAVPLAAEALIDGRRAAVDSPQKFVLIIMVRLRPEQPLAAATATIRAMQKDILGGDKLPRFIEEPFTLVPAATGTSGATPGIPGMRQQFQQPLLALLGIVGLVLLIACTTIANLLYARAGVRRHEWSVRHALGASRGRLFRQLLVESLVLAAIGAAVGLVAGVWTSRLLTATLSGEADPVVLNLSLDWRVFAFSAALTVLAAILFGTAPALRATRLVSGERSASTAGSTLPGGLVLQVALSVVLVVSAGLLTRTFGRLANLPLGFDEAGLHVVRVNTARARVSPDDRAALDERLIQAVGAIPGVARAAASATTPVDGGRPVGVKVAGRTSNTEDELQALQNAVTPGWFATYGTALLQGRDIEAQDRDGAPPVMIVNRTFATRFLPGQSALGASVSGRTVVGVVEDQIVQGGYKPDGVARSRRDEVAPMFYVPLAQSARPPDQAAITISVRRAADSPDLPAAAVAAALSSVSPDLSFTAVPFADRVGASIRRERLLAMLSGFFGLLALSLAGLGLYGLSAQAVARRRVEIGIRMALGADAADVVRLIVTRGLVLTAVGIALGIAGAALATRYLSGLLFGVTPLDTATFVGVPLAFAAVAALAAYLPARRATRVEPLIALRRE
jgi:putative ABC transport system permease protein